MTISEASCRCGALSVRCTGDPVRNSVCHCIACKQRTGSAFAWNLTFREEQVEIIGASAVFSSTSDSGGTARHHFCTTCGGTVYYDISARPGMISVPAGAFGLVDPGEPTVSVYEERMAPWLELRPKGPLERFF